MPLNIVRQDITQMNVDIIVNSASKGLQMGGGVCGAIFNAAGKDELLAECISIGRCNTGEAVITKGYNLSAKYIIHTVGAVYCGGNSGEGIAIKSCYTNSLKLAKEYNAESIAFPLISSGIYGYPKDKAVKVAIEAISEFLQNAEMQVYLVVFDKNSWQISNTLQKDITSYIDDNFVDEQEKIWTRDRLRSTKAYIGNNVKFSETNACYNAVAASAITQCDSLDEILQNTDLTFSEYLLKLIDSRNESDVTVYKRANVDRKHFSKIRGDKNYKPSKATAISFAIALKLSIDETKDLLLRAGYALSKSSKFDLIIQYFIDRQNYNINEINETLFAFDQILLCV